MYLGTNTNVYTSFDVHRVNIFTGLFLNCNSRRSPNRVTSCTGFVSVSYLVTTKLSFFLSAI